jgi:hypothetical protein
MPNQSLVPQTTLSVTTWTRPKHVAFLVDPHQVTDQKLNQIFRFNVDVWGGRFNPIIPTDGSQISPEWWKLLQLADPDIIYAFLPLADQLVWRINRHILPAKIVEIGPDDRARSGGDHLIWYHEINALGIESIPGWLWSNRGGIADPFFLFLEDRHTNTPIETFILRNFGLLTKTLSSTTAFRDLPMREMVPNETSAVTSLKEITALGTRAIPPIHLCTVAAVPSPPLNPEPFTQGFHLVIGNGPLDIIYAWNRALVTNPGVGRHTFWLPSDLNGIDEVLHILGKWMYESFFPPSNQYWGTVVSYSVDPAQLDTIAGTMRQLARCPFAKERLTQERFPCPRRAPYPNTRDKHTEQVPLSENKGQVGFARPPFEVSDSGQPGWMVDLEVQFHPERYAAYTNLRPHWQLPRRVGLADAFTPGRSARVTFGGLPSAEVEGKDKAIALELPSDLDLVWRYFQRHSNRNGKALYPAHNFITFERSDKGAYLQGLLRLFGNLFHAGHYFEDLFWRTIFLEMAGRPDGERQKRTARALEVLRTTLMKDPTPLDLTSPCLPDIAEELGRRLSLRDPSARTVTRNKLETLFNQLKAKSLKNPVSNNWCRPDETFSDWKEDDLCNLLDGQILLQGAEISCRHCGSKQWYVVDDLRSEMRCTGCLDTFPLPPTPDWCLRLNDLVGNALRYHGTMSVLQLLYLLQHRDLLHQTGKGMFLFLPCLDLYARNPDDPSHGTPNAFTDLDLLVIQDQKLMIGEVKSDPGGFTGMDFGKLKAVAEALQPDVVILAASSDSGEGWSAEVEGRMKEFAESLKPLEVEVRPILMQW